MTRRRTSSSSSPQATISSAVARLQRQPRREATPRLGEAVLPAGEPRRLGADVLDEEQLTVGPQHPHDLPQGEIGSVDGAQHEGRDDRVDRSVGERQPLRRRVDQPRPPAAAAQPLARGGSASRRSGSTQDQLVEVVGVVRQVQAGAAADLDGAARALAEQLLAVRAQSGPLAGPQEGVVDEPRRRAPRRAEPADGSTCVMSVSMTATDDGHRALQRIARPRPSAQDGPFG